VPAEGKFARIIAIFMLTRDRLMTLVLLFHKLRQVGNGPCVIFRTHLYFLKQEGTAKRRRIGYTARKEAREERNMILFYALLCVPQLSKSALDSYRVSLSGIISKNDFLMPISISIDTVLVVDSG